MTVLFGIVLAVGVLSWAIVKSDELSGLGRSVKPGSFRHPHGRLEATYCAALPERVPYAERLKRAVPWVTTLVSFVLAAVALFMESNGSVPAVVAVDLLVAGGAVLLIAGECLLRLPKESQTFTAYVVVAVAGLLIATVCALAVGLAGLTGLAGAAAAVVANIVGSAVGCALASAAVEQKVRFSRRFEDGAESDITVSPRSAAFHAYRELLVDEAAWKRGHRE